MLGSDPNIDPNIEQSNKQKPPEFIEGGFWIHKEKSI